MPVLLNPHSTQRIYSRNRCGWRGGLQRGGEEDNAEARGARRLAEAELEPKALFRPSRGGNGGEFQVKFEPGTASPLPPPRVFLGSADYRGLIAECAGSVDSRRLIVAIADSNRLQVVHNQRLNKK